MTRIISSVAAACALLTVAGAASAQSYSPGTNCQALPSNTQAGCMNQVQQLNKGKTGSTVVPNSAGSKTVPAPGTNTGTTLQTPAVRTPNSAANPALVVPPSSTGTTGN